MIMEAAINPADWKYVIRVYAIIVNEKKEVLLSDEIFQGVTMTKFPGGGMEFGEGTVDCLKREAVEEFGQEIEIIRHFYTTDFFQASRFHSHTQLISIYYIAEFKEPIQFKIANRPFDFTGEVNGTQSFRWKAIRDLQVRDVTFPIDQHVVNLLKQELV